MALSDRDFTSYEAPTVGYFAILVFAGTGRNGTFSNLISKTVAKVRSHTSEFGQQRVGVAIEGFTTSNTHLPSPVLVIL